MIRALWRRVRDFYVDQRTRQRIGERECTHDDPNAEFLCDSCLSNSSPW